jgi:hypothetical protein
MRRHLPGLSASPLPVGRLPDAKGGFQQDEPNGTWCCWSGSELGGSQPADITLYWTADIATSVLRDCVESLGNLSA